MRCKVSKNFIYIPATNWDVAQSIFCSFSLAFLSLSLFLSFSVGLIWLWSHLVLVFVRPTARFARQSELARIIPMWLGFWASVICLVYTSSRAANISLVLFSSLLLLFCLLCCARLLFVLLFTFSLQWMLLLLIGLPRLCLCTHSFSSWRFVALPCYNFIAFIAACENYRQHNNDYVMHKRKQCHTAIVRSRWRKLHVILNVKDFWEWLRGRQAQWIYR